MSYIAKSGFVRSCPSLTQSTPPASRFSARSPCTEDPPERVIWRQRCVEATPIVICLAPQPCLCSCRKIIVVVDPSRKLPSLIRNPSKTLPPPNHQASVLSSHANSLHPAFSHACFHIYKLHTSRCTHWPFVCRSKEEAGKPPFFSGPRAG